MALGAFSDNFYKNAVIILITYLLAEQLGYEASVLISLAAAFFILPFFLFSGIAGELADRHAKHRLTRFFKITELVLCGLASLALLTHHLYGLLIVLFLFGTQAAFFSPVKYAILPELLKKNELVMGNGMVEAGTFLCILTGTLAGGLLILAPHGVKWVSAILITLALLGIYAAFRITTTPAAQSSLRVRYHPLATTRDLCRHGWRHPNLWRAMMANSWFWAIGTTYLTQIPVFTKQMVGGNEQVASVFFALFSVGIGMGSLGCQWVLRRWPQRNVPLLALTGIALFGLHLSYSSWSLTAGDTLIGLREFLSGGLTPWLIVADLLLLSVCGGLFIVPLYTTLQTQSKPSERARTIAANNMFNALFSALAAIIAAILFAVGVHVKEILLLFAAANIGFIGYLRRQ